MKQVGSDLAGAALIDELQEVTNVILKCVTIAASDGGQDGITQSWRTRSESFLKGGEETASKDQISISSSSCGK